MIFSSIIFLGVVSPLIALECLEPDGPCKCHTDQGLIDLSPLDSTNGEPRFKLELNHGGDVYSYNPCTPFSLPGCHGSLICKTNSNDYTGPYRRRKTQYSAPVLDKNNWMKVSSIFHKKHQAIPVSLSASGKENFMKVASNFFKHDDQDGTEPTSYSIGRSLGYQWSGEDIWDIPPDSREQLDSEHLFINLMGNSPQSDVFRTSSVELVCNHHIESNFRLKHSDRTHHSEKYLFTLTTRYACTVEDDGHPDHNVTETVPTPDHHPTHGPHTTNPPTHNPHPHPHPTHNPSPDPKPQPTDEPIPDEQLDDCLCLDDSEVVVSKKTLVVASVSAFVIILLVMVISMYCTLICCVPKKSSKPKQQNMKVYAITTGESDKKELLA